jgi:uncharacterized membrane protein YdbT with pleckstrin-like domain
VAFPREQLQDDEELILDLSPHWLFLAPAAVALIAAIGVGLFCLVAIADSDGAVWGWPLGVFAAILVVAALLFFGFKYLRWTKTEFVVTSERLVYRQGFINKRGVQMPLDKVNTVDFSQKLFERMINAGDLLIESGSDSGVQRFTDIPKPTAVQHEIIHQMDLHAERARSVILPAGVGGAPLSVAEQLEKLATLRERGHLTDGEFEAEKARLLRPPAP